MNHSMPGLPVHHQFPEFSQTHVHWVGDAIQPSHLLSSPSPPAFNLSQHQGLFQWVSSSHLVVKVLESQLQHQYSNEYSGLISFRMDWLDLLAVQGTLKSLLQHHSSKASILQHSAFFLIVNWSFKLEIMVEVKTRKRGKIYSSFPSTLMTVRMWFKTEYVHITLRSAQFIFPDFLSNENRNTAS